MKELTEQEQVKSFIYGIQVILKGYSESLDNADNGTIATDNVKAFVNEIINYIEERKKDIEYLN